MRNGLRFLGRALRNPSEVASPWPSSPATVKKIAGMTTKNIRQVVVELGAGDGAVSLGLLKEGVLTPDSTLILVEKDDDLIQDLRSAVHDDRARIFHDDARNIRAILEQCNEKSANVVISGIPYSRIPEDVRKSIVEETALALAPDGKHIVYQLWGTVRKTLQDFFPDITKTRAWKNFPPLQIFEARFSNDPVTEPRTSASPAS